jgi:hypothetical protein
MRKSLLFLFTLLFLSILSLNAQNDCSICKSVENGKFNKIEHFIKKEVRKYKNGIEFFNGPGSGMQVSHSENLDTICEKLRQFPCVEDAYWDKCAMKASIYPGWAVIGVRLKTNNGVVEKCFHIQMGTMGNVNFFGCKFHVFKYRSILKYKKMYDSEGFIEKERENCKKEKLNH